MYTRNGRLLPDSIMLQLGLADNHVVDTVICISIDILTVYTIIYAKESPRTQRKVNEVFVLLHVT